MTNGRVVPYSIQPTDGGRCRVYCFSAKFNPLFSSRVLCSLHIYIYILLPEHKSFLWRDIVGDGLQGGRSGWRALHIVLPLAIVDIYRGVFILIMKIDCIHRPPPLPPSLYPVPSRDNRLPPPTSNATVNFVGLNDGCRLGRLFLFFVFFCFLPHFYCPHNHYCYFSHSLFYFHTVIEFTSRIKQSYRRQSFVVFRSFSYNM